MSFEDGRLKDGMWENGIFKGKTVMADGSEIDENMKRDQKLLKSFIKMTSEEGKINQQFKIVSTDQTKVTVNTTREPNVVRVKTRGGSNSVNRIKMIS